MVTAERTSEALGVNCTGLSMPDAAWFLRPDGRDGSGTIHGIGHTHRVMIHAAELADELRSRSGSARLSFAPLSGTTSAGPSTVATTFTVGRVRGR